MKLRISKKKTVIWLTVILFLVSALIRWRYYAHAPGVFVSEDTYSYYLAGEKMIKDKTFVHDFRPPVYPFFLHASMVLTGHAGTPILSADFFRGANLVVFVQFVLSTISVVLLFFTLRNIGFRLIYSFLFSLFVSLNPLIYSWDRLLLTESLSTTLLIIYLFFIVKTIRKPYVLNFLLLLFLSIILVMTRPIFLLLPLTVLIPISFLCKRKTVAFSIIVLLVFYFSFLHLYQSENLHRNHYYGVSTASPLVLFGKILDFELPIEQAQDVPFYYQAVTDFRKTGLDQNPFRFLEYFQMIPFGRTKEEIDNLLLFNKKVLSANFGQYLIKSSSQIPYALGETSEKTVLLPHGNSIEGNLFNILFGIYKKFQIVFLAVFVFVPVSLLIFLKKPGRINTFVTLCGLVSLYQIVFAVFFGYAEFARLLIPAQPVMYLFVFYWLAFLLKSLVKKLAK